MRCVAEQADFSFEKIGRGRKVVEEGPDVGFFDKGDDGPHGGYEAREGGGHFLSGGGDDPFLVVPFAVGFAVVADYVDVFAVGDEGC